MFFSFKKRLDDLEKRIEELEYREPKNLQEFYQKYKYLEVEQLNRLDARWLQNRLFEDNYYIGSYVDDLHVLLKYDPELVPLYGKYVGQIIEEYWSYEKKREKLG